jgi:hypothetical protein
MNVMLNNLHPNGAPMPTMHDDDDLSDISETSDFHQGNGAALTDPRKKNRILWTTEKEDFLLRCYNHYRLTSSSDHGLKGKSWRRIAFRMTNHFAEEYDSKSCRNKLNVLRYDYISFKEILDAKLAGVDNDSFWHQITEKYPRSSRWRDSDYPHADIMKKIFDLNGGECVMGNVVATLISLSFMIVTSFRSTEGIEGLAESDGEQLLAKTTAKKRPRESFGGPVGTTSPKNRRQSTVSMLRGDTAGEEMLARLFERLDQGLKEILDEFRKSHDPRPDARSLAMEELNKDRYRTILTDDNSRDVLFEAFRDQNLSKDFVLFPDNFKINFLQDVLVKRRGTVGNNH